MYMLVSCGHGGGHKMLECVILFCSMHRCRISPGPSEGAAIPDQWQKRNQPILNLRSSEECSKYS